MSRFRHLARGVSLLCAQSMPKTVKPRDLNAADRTAFPQKSSMAKFPFGLKQRGGSTRVAVLWAGELSRRVGARARFFVWFIMFNFSLACCSFFRRVENFAALTSSGSLSTTEAVSSDPSLSDESTTKGNPAVFWRVSALPEC